MRGWTKKDSSLRTHLMLFYVLLAVLGGVIVPALVRHLSLSGFQDYLGRRRTSDLEELGSCLESLTGSTTAGRTRSCSKPWIL